MASEKILNQKKEEVTKDSDVKEIYDLVLKNQCQTEKELKEGLSIKILSRMVENDFQLHGYDLVHSLGHGVGLDIHEYPFLSGKHDNLLKANMVVTNEPRYLSSWKIWCTY